jgi:hypothetical protein
MQWLLVERATALAAQEALLSRVGGHYLVLWGMDLPIHIPKCTRWYASRCQPNVKGCNLSRRSATGTGVLQPVC